MGTLYNSIPITAVAPSLAAILGIAPPEKSGPSMNLLTRAADAAFSGRHADRILIYNPDAVALWLFQKYTALFEDAVLHSDVQLPLLSVMPSVTPVCFASMYTGAMPAVHGIQSYVKPVLQTDTLFDACLRAEKKAAIVSTAGDSISKIFLERAMDYFIYEHYDACNEKALELIAQDRYDLIVVYNPNYDAAMHRNGPEAPVSLDMLRHNLSTYQTFVRAVQNQWRAHRAVVGFCPDHGCHEIDGNLGSHGLDMPEDMNVIHFYRFFQGSEAQP